MDSLFLIIIIMIIMTVVMTVMNIILLVRYKNYEYYDLNSLTEKQKKELELRLIRNNYLYALKEEEEINRTMQDGPEKTKILQEKTEKRRYAYDLFNKKKNEL